jgi:cytochrome c biogenesis protein
MSVTTSGMQSKSSRRAVRHFVELVSSMRFAIALLVVLAIASIIGTVLTQEDPYPNYVNQFGPFWADIFRGVSLYNVYSAWWFMLIMIFLVISVSLCVIRNGPKMIADMKSWKDRVREAGLRAFHHKGEFEVSTSRAETSVAQARLQVRRARNQQRRDAHRRQARRAHEARLYLGACGDRRNLSRRPARQQLADKAANVAFQQDAGRDQRRY